MMNERAKPKVLLIGWDAADWKVITPLLEEGKMPHLERMINEGVKGNLATIQPALSPMLWTSIATGKRAFKHGIHGFVEPDPQTSAVRPITNLSRKTKAIWNILNLNGGKCNVVGWWPSHPAEPINGVMVSNHFQQAGGKLSDPWPMRPGTVHPERLVKPLSGLRIHPWELEGNDLLPFVPKGAEVDQEKDKRLLNIAKTIAECSGIHAAATAIMQLEPWDFMGVYYDAIDHFCHGFMKYHPPRRDYISEADFEKYKDVVVSGYRYHDLMLGALLALAGEETTVILMSDHGFHPDHLRPQFIPNEPAGPAAEHRGYGILVMKGPGIKKDDLVFGATILDIAPTILTLFGLPIGEDMDGKPLLNALDSIPEITTLPSWDEVDGEDGSHPPDLRLDPVDSQAAMKQLVDLGYIEKPDENRERAVAECVRELQYNLARSYMDAHHYQEAAEILSRLWEDWSDESRLGIRLLECQIALGQPEAARKTIDRIQENKKRYTREAREELEKFNSKLKAEGKKPEDLSVDEKRRMWKVRARAGFNQTALAFLEAEVFCAEKKYPDALSRLELALKAQTNHQPSVHKKMAECYIALKDWRAAEKHFGAALELDEEDAQAWLGMCRCHLHRRRNLEAAAAALKSIGLLFHNPFAHYYYGVALHRCGRVKRAIEALNMAVAQNPRFPKAYERLAMISKNRLKDANQARKYTRLAREALSRIQSIKESKASGNGKSDLKPGVETLDLNTGPGQFLSRVRFEEKSPRDLITVVSGLPRSGTSLMMQMLKAGGLPLYTDEARAADASNPKGYFEAERVKGLMKDRGWLKEAVGKGVKVIAPLATHLSPEFYYRIIFMERDLKEVVASQAAMLANLGKTGADVSGKKMEANYKQQLIRIKTIFAGHPQVSIISISYPDVISDPAKAASRVSHFIDPGNELRFNLEAMAAAVDCRLYRQRRETVI